MMASADLAQLVAPVLHWDPAAPAALRAAALRAAADRAGAVVLPGGPSEAIRDAVALLHDRSAAPLLVGASVERGAGERFGGLTAFPPPAALASLGEEDVIRHAARLAARELRLLGVNWALAPVCDLGGDTGPGRAFGPDPATTAALAAEWIDACQSQGVLACAKHFPGASGVRSVDDVYARLLVPFRAAIDAGVASVLVSHRPVPALAPSGVPAALAGEVVTGVLRKQLGFDGLVVADVRLLAHSLPATDPAELAVRAVVAGCDLVVVAAAAPVLRALGEAERAGRLDVESVARSLRRRSRWAEWGAPGTLAAGEPSPTEPSWADEVAERLVHLVRGVARPLRGRAEVLVLDDAFGSTADAAGTFVRTLRDAGVDASASATADGDAGRTLVVALMDGGAPGRAAARRAALERAGAAAGRAARDLVVVHFAPPRDAAELPAPDVVCAWSADPVMQRAAARWLARR